jgi:hypothetical protein
VVINNLATRLQAGEDQTEVLRDMVNSAFLPAEGLDPQNLKDFADEEMPAEVAAFLNELVDSMTKVDIRATLWHINNVADRMRFIPFQHEGFRDGLSWAVNCAEDINLVDPGIIHEVIAAADDFAIDFVLPEETE